MLTVTLKLQKSQKGDVISTITSSECIQWM